MDWCYPRYIAHRGGGALAPENTLAGIRLAARMGFRTVEFDVMLSADGVPVLFHDETLDRTTGRHGKLAQQNLVTLRNLDASRNHHPAFAGEPIPTLAEALAACRELALAANIELKPGPGLDHATGVAVARQVVESLRGSLQMSLLLSSFSEAALTAVRKTAPEIPRALLVTSIPVDWQDRLRQLDCQALHCAADHFQPEKAAPVTAAGYPLACYTVNRQAAAEQLFAAGVSAIFTDRLDLFTAFP